MHQQNIQGLGIIINHSSIPDRLTPNRLELNNKRILDIEMLNLGICKMEKGRTYHRTALQNLSPFENDVSVMNLSVRGLVTLGLPGLRQSATPPVCWKRWRNRIIVFLWQPNALLRLETLSTQASIINAWICLFWFILVMFSDKCCEIKCFFFLCSGYKDYVYTHFLWHVPWPRTVGANQAILCIAI